jgi:RNA polymerase sigma factor (sigma-70 family)
MGVSLPYYFTLMGSLIENVKAYQQTLDLAARIRLGEEIVQEIAPWLYLIIYGKNDIEVAEVVFQETLRSISSKLHQFKGETEGQFRSWCRTIARNARRQHIRKATRDITDAMDPEVMEELIAADPQPMSQGEKLDLEYAMKLLLLSKPSCCILLWYRFVVEYSYDEIAEIFDLVTTAAARMQVARCLKLAQDLIGE